jgi:hypothetical protein
MFSFVPSPPVAPAAQAPVEVARTPQAAPPDLGPRAVTATADGQTLRNDPGPPQPAPPVPAPLKGLGIPPLNTRQVGDFDKIDDPPPPPGLALDTRLADLDAPPAMGLDLRR